MTSPVRPSDPVTEPGCRRPADRSGKLRRVLAMGALGVAGVALAACGSSSSASTSSSSSTTTGGAPSGSSGAATRPGASGTIAAINGTSLEVQNPITGQTTVNYTPSTTFRQTLPTSATAVTVGSCISAFGTPSSGSSSGGSAFGSPVTATTVSVSQPVSGTCSGGFGGRGPGGARPGGGSGFTPGNGTRPAGARGFGNGRFGVASGAVTAVNGSGVTINEINPVTKATSSVTVTLTASTTFTTTSPASSTDLALGKCARANGTADATGAISARSITISTAGPNGCTGGFGRAGGVPGGGGASA